MARIRNKAPFRFKQFSCSHHRSALRIGVDAVILGAWSQLVDAAAILDVGCGCGVLSLMAAQRNDKARILGIDIDEASVEEASENFRLSPWPERIRAKRLSLFDMPEDTKFDYIISNPPFFDSGISNPETSRELARHQSELSPASLLKKGSKLLAEGGKIGLVLPEEMKEVIISEAEDCCLELLREMHVAGREGKTPKRCYLEFGLAFAEQANTRNEKPTPERMYLTVETIDGGFTDEYRRLCAGFYLKF